MLPRTLSASLATIVDFPSNMHEAKLVLLVKDYLKALLAGSAFINQPVCSKASVYPIQQVLFGPSNQSKL